MQKGFSESQIQTHECMHVHTYTHTHNDISWGTQPAMMYQQLTNPHPLTRASDTCTNYDHVGTILHTTTPYKVHSEPRPKINAATSGPRASTDSLSVPKGILDATEGGRESLWVPIQGPLQNFLISSPVLTGLISHASDIKLPTTP